MGGRAEGGCLFCGGGFGEPALELSQHTEPLVQVVGDEINTEGLSQKAAIILSKQKPGHLGILGGACGAGCCEGPFPPLKVFSANDRICENKSLPPDCVEAVAGGEGGGCFCAGFEAGFG